MSDRRLLDRTQSLHRPGLACGLANLMRGYWPRGSTTGRAAKRSLSPQQETPVGAIAFIGYGRREQIDECGMRKPKSRGKKKKIPPKRAPRPVENPGWLLEEPDGNAPKPPVRTQASLLPFTELKWEDFERLCLRLSERRANVEAAWSYGKSGHAQARHRCSRS